MDSLNGLGVKTLELDVTNDGSIIALKEAVSVIVNGRLDILINNAGQSSVVVCQDLCQPY